jgi:hypothetical protein
MKKIVVTVLTVLMLISLIPTVSGCASVPAVEEIYDRVVFLVEESYELNALFYGCGLPVWEEDSEYVDFMHLYYGLNSAQSYEMITQNAKFYSVDEIKQAAEKVYSKDYLNDVLYKTAFDGYAIEDGAGGAVVGVSRYYENEGYFWQAKNHKIFYTAMRIYDYSTMQVHALGRGDACVVTMDSWLEDTPEKVENVEIPLVLQDGKWFLDNFTGG